MAMMSCPKCGFTQPADQYCASCGVDMKVWRPREKPFIVRLATNTVFQIVVVTLVVGITFAYMRENRRSELAARVKAIEIARQAEENDNEISAAQAPRPRATNNASTSGMRPQAVPAAPPAPPPSAQAQTAYDDGGGSNSLTTNEAPALPSAQGDARAASASLPTSARAGAPTSAQVTFYEMSRTFAASLLANSSQSTSEGSLSMGVVTAFAARVRQQTSRELDSASQPLQVNQPGLIFKGARDQATGTNLGFTVQINPVGLDEAGAQLQIDIARVLRDSGPSGLEEANFAPGETFLVPKGAALVVVGLLPRKTQTEVDATFYKNVGVLKPLTSAAFIGGQSEAVLVIEAR
ncbi:MAG: hypothetical protein AAB250_02465 [Bdellovibrionota bacterium]